MLGFFTNLEVGGTCAPSIPAMWPTARLPILRKNSPRLVIGLIDKWSRPPTLEGASVGLDCVQETCDSLLLSS